MYVLKPCDGNFEQNDSRLFRLGLIGEEHLVEELNRKAMDIAHQANNEFGGTCLVIESFVHKNEKVEVQKLINYSYMLCEMKFRN